MWRGAQLVQGELPTAGLSFLSSCPQLAALRLIKECDMPTVLIVDDCPAVRSAIRAGLQRSEFSVCGEAVDGIEGIEKATKLNPDFVVLDLSMPGMNGIETASVLKRLMPCVLIVAFSMHAELLTKSLASVVGINAVVGKFEGMGKLVECFRTLLSEPA
jgi:DNA-binding NarL/FixJ family response regulator